MAHIPEMPVRQAPRSDQSAGISTSLFMSKLAIVLSLIAMCQSCMAYMAIDRHVTGDSFLSRDDCERELPEVPTTAPQVPQDRVYPLEASTATGPSLVAQAESVEVVPAGLRTEDWTTLTPDPGWNP